MRCEIGRRWYGMSASPSPILPRFIELYWTHSLVPSRNVGWSGYRRVSGWTGCLIQTTQRDSIDRIMEIAMAYFLWYPPPPTVWICRPRTLCYHNMSDMTFSCLERRLSVVKHWTYSGGAGADMIVFVFEECNFFSFWRIDTTVKEKLQFWQFITFFL